MVFAECHRLGNPSQMLLFTCCQRHLQNARRTFINSNVNEQISLKKNKHIQFRMRELLMKTQNFQQISRIYLKIDIYDKTLKNLSKIRINLTKKKLKYSNPLLNHIELGIIIVRVNCFPLTTLIYIFMKIAKDPKQVKQSNIFNSLVK